MWHGRLWVSHAGPCWATCYLQPTPREGGRQPWVIGQFWGRRRLSLNLAFWCGHGKAEGVQQKNYQLEPNWGQRRAHATMHNQFSLSSGEQRRRAVTQFHFCEKRRRGSPTLMPVEARQRLHKEGPEHPHAQMHIGHGNRPPAKPQQWVGR